MGGWESLSATIMGMLPDRFNRGWEPLPQSKSLKLTSLIFLGSEEVSYSIKRAALVSNGGAEP
jgi:hypothetical protein